MRLFRYAAFIVLLLLLATIGLMLWAARPALPPINAVIPPDAAAVQRGAALAALGDCVVCHTAAHGEPFAGGRPLPTPFGTVYATNITPDPEAGIGRWSEAAFVRAMRDGVDREGEHLYPAFPYDHFEKTSEADLSALYAYLMTRDAVAEETPPNELVFPLNFRPLLAVWKALFLDRAPFRGDPARTTEWNVGAYLVEGLGHCGACHTPRNALGAVMQDRPLGGGEAEGWRAPALDHLAQAPVPWDAEALFAYLRTGMAPGHEVAAGPMLPVVRDLALAPEADVRAIAIYLASLTGSAAGTSRAAEHAVGEAPTVAANEAGKMVYRGACAGCHELPRDSFFRGALDLRQSASMRAVDPVNAVNVVLGGIVPPEGDHGPWMPPFLGVLTEAQVVALVQYLRTGVAAQPPWPAVDETVRKAVAKGGA